MTDKQQESTQMWTPGSEHLVVEKGKVTWKRHGHADTALDHKLNGFGLTVTWPGGTKSKFLPPKKNDSYMMEHGPSGHVQWKKE